MRDFESEKRQREFLAAWGPAVPPEAGDAKLPDFEAQCQAVLAVAPTAMSSIMGIYRAGVRSRTESARNHVVCDRHLGC